MFVNINNAVIHLIFSMFKFCQVETYNKIFKMFITYIVYKSSGLEVFYLPLSSN